MKRKMIAAAAAYMLGLFFASFFNEASDLLLAGGLLALFFVFSRIIKMKVVDCFIIVLFFGASTASGIAYHKLVYERTTALSGTAGSFAGEVIESKYFDGDWGNFTLKGKINHSVPATVVYFGKEVNAEYGDFITLENCQFQLPEKDYLFDNRTYYKSKGIFLTASDPEKITVKSGDSHSIIKAVKNYRNDIVMDFRIALGDEKGGFLAGLLFGDKRFIDDAEKTMMYRCGIGHILAVSGLHVGLLAAVLMIALKSLRIGKILSFIILNIFMALLIIMADAPVSCIRAAIMLDFMYSAEIFRRQNDSFNSVSAAVIILAAANPFIIYDPGFWLSVTATLGIAVFAPYMTKNIKKKGFIRKRWADILTMICVLVMILPVDLMFFDEVSIISPITNLIILPLVFLAMIPALVYTLTAGTVSFLEISDIAISLIQKISRGFGSLNFCYISSNDFIISVVIISWITVFVAALILKKQKYIAVLTAVCIGIASLLSSINNYRSRNIFHVAVLGKGSAAVIVINSGGRTEIIDLSGNHNSPDYVKKYLSCNGISSVDSLVLAERSPSQYSAYMPVMKVFNVEKIYAESSLSFSDERVQYFGDDPLEISGGDYTVKYHNSTLTIKCNEFTIAFAPGRYENAVSANAVFYYGRRKKNSSPKENSFYLEEINNTEIYFGSSGIELRRL